MPGTPSVGVPSIVGPGESQSFDPDMESGGVAREGQTEPVLMRSSRRAEVSREDGHPVAEGEVSELARVTSGYAHPQTGSSVGASHFEVGEKFPQQIHGLLAAGG